MVRTGGLSAAFFINISHFSEGRGACRGCGSPRSLVRTIPYNLYRINPVNTLKHLLFIPYTR